MASSTGWPEDYIRHELPLSRGYAYYHAARLLAGENCRWPHHTTRTSKWIDTLKNWARKNLT